MYYTQLICLYRVGNLFVNLPIGHFNLDGYPTVRFSLGRVYDQKLGLILV